MLPPAPDLAAPLAGAFVLTDPVHSVGAAAVVLLVLLGLLLLLDIVLDSRVTVGLSLFLVGLSLAFFLLGGGDIGGVLAAAVAAIGSAAVIDHMGWL